jgi:hypothetical protein
LKGLQRIELSTKCVKRNSRDCPASWVRVAVTFNS